MNKEQWWNDTEGGGEIKVLGAEPVPVPLYPPQISRGLAWD
jgi:hypothetical protein